MSLNQQQEENETIEAFHCVLPMQMRYTDYDMNGHLNNTAYFSVFDVAKMEYFKAVRNGDEEWKDVSIVAANINVNFLASTVFEEPLAVESKCTHVGEKSLTLVQRLVNSDTREVKCVCTNILVYYDLKTHTSTFIAPYWRHAIATFEKTQPRTLHPAL